MSELDRAIEAIQQGTPERGCELLSHWLDRNPGRAELHLMLALTQASLGRIQDAITSLKSAIAAKPGLASAHYNLGTLLQQSGQSKAALLELRVAVAQDPTHERAWINLSATAFYSMELTLAELAARRALELDPKSLEAWVNLGNALKGQARIAQALSAYEQASLIDPNYEVAASNALLARCYIEQDAALICAAHQRNGARIAATITARACPARKPQKQMRIGYVSGDFRFHAVAYFFGSLLKCHDRSQFDVCLYSDVERPDMVSQQMARAATAWCDVTKLSDEELCAKIRDDCIDVLVDLSGHTGRRLGVFARRAAATLRSYLDDRSSIVKTAAILLAMVLSVSAGDLQLSLPNTPKSDVGRISDLVQQLRKNLNDLPPDFQRMAVYQFKADAREFRSGTTRYLQGRVEEAFATEGHRTVVNSPELKTIRVHSTDTSFTVSNSLPTLDELWKLAEKLQQGAYTHLAVEAALLGEVSDQVVARAGHLVAEHADLSPVGIKDVDDHADGGGLPAPVGTDKTEDAPIGNAEGEVIHGGDLAESLGDA